MARITLRQLLDHAAEHEYGVPAFNLNNMEQGLAIMAAADATDSQAVAGIYSAKGRPSFNPLIVHVADMEMARRLADYYHLPHLDTGLLYRAVGALGGDPVAAAENLSPQDLLRPDLRTAEAGQAASRVATDPQVRAALE